MWRVFSIYLISWAKSVFFKERIRENAEKIESLVSNILHQEAH